MDATLNSAKDVQKEAEKKSSLGSKIVFALAFSTVGAKLGTIGTAIDGAELLKHEPDLKSKMRGVVDGTLMKNLNEKIEAQIREKYKDHKGVIEPNPGDVMKASGKVFKYTLVTTAIGMAAGAVLGWMRGSQVEKASDIIIHPIRSLKLVLGIGQKPEKTETVSAVQEPLVSERLHGEKKESVSDATRADWAQRMRENSMQPGAQVR